MHFFHFISNASYVHRSIIRSYRHLNLYFTCLFITCLHHSYLLLHAQFTLNVSMKTILRIFFSVFVFAAVVLCIAEEVGKNRGSREQHSVLLSVGDAKNAEIDAVKHRLHRDRHRRHHSPHGGHHRTHHRPSHHQPPYRSSEDHSHHNETSAESDSAKDSSPELRHHRSLGCHHHRHHHHKHFEHDSGTADEESHERYLSSDDTSNGGHDVKRGYKNKHRKGKRTENFREESYEKGDHRRTREHREKSGKDNGRESSHDMQKKSHKNESEEEEDISSQ
ncbi:hypothetical protein AB6A40_001050 [Gnathostoma spinigerum]|uniref:Histidine-rich glycoprotein-like n=1 Tax=Gnathostoma spinigerum TaxID=75299 RepID=A0ABD6E5H9_9BILA